MFPPLFGHVGESEYLRVVLDPVPIWQLSRQTVGHTERETDSGTDRRTDGRLEKLTGWYRKKWAVERPRDNL